MRKTGLLIVAFWVSGFGLCAWIEPWFQTWGGNRTGSGNLLAVALGDSRKLFANHVYAKADAYFHNGYYPSIFDYKDNLKSSYLSQRIGLQEKGNVEAGAHFLGEPRDWIDRFSRSFFPSRHAHLGENLRRKPSPANAHADCDHDHDHEPGEACPEEHAPKEGAACDHGPGCCDHGHEEADASQEGLEREILPWLRLSASLDPNRVETYVVAAFWLRTRLQKADQAEQFLREGLRANPGSQEILFELGRIYYEDRKDATRARNVWELALRSWETHEQNATEPNVFLGAQILGNLAKLEDEQHQPAQAIRYLEKLVEISPQKESLRQWIEELKRKSG